MKKQTCSVSFLVLLMLTGLMLGACTDQVTEVETPVGITETAPKATTIETLTLKEISNRVIQALAARDMGVLAQFVHPEKGVRFSPYTYVREEHLVFMPGELPGLPGSDKVFNWGQYDGSGEPINLTFSEYYDEFVYSVDFANPEQIGYDQEIGQSSMTNNLHDFYPGSSYVEFYFSGFDPQYAGMDWQSLRLVFVQEKGRWWLVGIVHDEWTI